MTRRNFAILLILPLAACSAGSGGDNAGAGLEPSPVSSAQRSAEPSKPESTIERVETIAKAIAAWRDAPDLGTAKRQAEAARNLIVGPRGPGYGDANGDGVVSGSTEVGLLPGMDGGQALAIPAANDCVTRDLLGGSWDEPEKRWDILRSKIDSWRPDNNTFPSLPSHAQRIVGWATLTLNSADVAEAREYGGHAQIHGNVSLDALIHC